MSDLSDSEKWDGDWNSKRGLEIQLKMKKKEDYVFFRERITRDICIIILKCLWIITACIIVLSCITELSMSIPGYVSGIRYLGNGIINLLTKSPFQLRISVYALIISIIVSLIILLIYPIEKKGEW